MQKVKVYGAGSIGNHLANASRRMGWSVDIGDIDPAALERTSKLIYPMRYGKWDEEIRLFNANDMPVGGYDYIFIGTPPDHHIELAKRAVKEKPKAVLVEKPFCCPDLKGAQELVELARELGVAVFTGYDHVVGKAAQRCAELMHNKALGKILTLDVEFREHWGGIFNAHPWLKGPWETYLGYWQRGGGAAGEHSHAANLWQFYAHTLGAGRVTEVSAHLEYVKDEKVDYDQLALINVKTEKGLSGRIVQDVVTQPHKKWARAQYEKGAVEWHCNYKPGMDFVKSEIVGGEVLELSVPKTRPEDFIQELTHIESAIASKTAAQSPISMERGLETMLLVAAVHESSRLKQTVHIDYTKGFTKAALSH